MQKHKTPFIQLLLGLLFIIFTMLVIRDTTHSLTVIADNLPSTGNQLNNVSIIHNPPNSLPAFSEQPQSVPELNAGTVITPTNCRYGVSSWNNNDYNFLQDLGIGWALNFGVRFGQNLPDGVEYTPMIRFKPELDGNGQRTGNYLVKTQPFTDEADGLGDIVRANPGSLWLVGNEVDRVDVQDDLMPDVYAMAYHDAYHFIKERDPSAQIAISGLVEVTPGRLQYLDLVWDSYLEKYGTPMPVDVWNMHIYILAEKHPDGTDAAAAIALGTDPDIAILSSDLNPAQCAKDNVYCYAEHDDMGIFVQQVVAMRQWMKDHGQQNKPLILSEYSLLYQYTLDSPDSCFLMDEFGNCFTPERVSQFMVDSFDYLQSASDETLGFPADNNRLVQQWLWFTVNMEDSNFSSDLLEDGYTLTDYVLRLPGETFKAEVNNLRPFSTNPFIDAVSYPTVSTITPTGTTSATIAATIYNNGDTATTTPITVTFFADEPKTDEIGTAVISSPLGGCARHSEDAQVLWTGLTTGTNFYWAEVEGGNTVKGVVFVNSEQVFLPTTKQ